MKSLNSINFQDSDADQQFVASLHDIGFAVLENHPLDMQLVSKIYADWRAFFATDEKFQFELNKDTQDGYFSFEKAESAKGFSKQDCKEYFHYYPWGKCPDALRGSLQQYYDAAHKFAATLLRWVELHSPAEVAAGYSQPLPNMIENSDVTLLRVLHYPPMDNISDDEVTWAAAHEDINLLTILPASDAPGLQVQAQDGQWIDVKSNQNQVIINIGDMLQEASNRYFPSTSHRVVSPAGQDHSDGRMSLPLFLHPRPDVKLSERYTAGSYLHERLTELGVI